MLRQGMMATARFFSFDLLAFKARLTSNQSLKESERRDVDRYFDKRREFAKKILSIQESAHPGRPAVLPVAPAKTTFRIRVSKARAHCHRHFLSGFDKLELTEAQIAERRHALAQDLIARVLKESDPRPRRRLIPLSSRNIILPNSSTSSCIQWLQQPFELLARVASVAASKLEISQAAVRVRKHSARVTNFPLDDSLPLLSVCEAF